MPNPLRLNFLPSTGYNTIIRSWSIQTKSFSKLKNVSISLNPTSRQTPTCIFYRIPITTLSRSPRNPGVLNWCARAIIVNIVGPELVPMKKCRGYVRTVLDGEVTCSAVSHTGLFFLEICGCCLCGICVLWWVFLLVCLSCAWGGLFGWQCGFL